MSVPDQEPPLDEEPPAPPAGQPWRLLIIALVVAIGMALGPVLLVAQLSAVPGGTGPDPSPPTPSAGVVSARCGDP